MGKGGCSYFSGYPKHVFLILGNEFCERFSFYGMKAILVLFLNRALNYSDNASTSIYHGFNMACYFTPIFGAMLADGFIGKYRTILYISFIYAAGNATMAMAAIPWGDEYHAWITFLGLVLIAIGTGGIKPCVSAFGADQFDEDQVKQKETFFSLFYMAINLGSFASTVITPILRSSVYCFDDNCYALAFGVPAALMIVAVIFFIAGSAWYKRTPPGDNVLGNAVGCVVTAIGQRCKHKGPSKDHWLDYADVKYDEKFIEDVKSVMRVLYMFIPLPLFWALYDQQGSRWVLQAGQMDGDFGSFVIPPDLMHIFNSLFILIMVPAYETIIYPCLDKIGIPTRPLQRLGGGMFLASLAFAVTGFIQIYIDSSLPAGVSLGETRVQFINAVPCNTIEVAVGELPPQTIGYMQQTANYDITSGEYESSIAISGCSNGLGDGTVTFTLNGTNEDSYNYVIGHDGADYVVLTYFQNQTERTGKGQSNVVFINAVSSTLSLYLKSKGSEETDPRIFSLESLGPANYQNELPHTGFNFKANESISILEGTDPMLAGSYDLDLGTINSVAGALYTTVIQYDNNGGIVAVQHQDISGNDVNIFWQLPQYYIMCLGEVLFSVTGLSFAYSQSPPTMRAVMQAAWLLTNSMGNLIVMIISGVGTMDDMVAEFFLFAGLMLGAVIIFGLMSLSYVYVDPDAYNDGNKDDEDLHKTYDSPDDIERQNRKSDVPVYTNEAFDTSTEKGLEKEREANGTGVHNLGSRRDSSSSSDSSSNGTYDTKF